jgi:hypothetical protein
MATRTTWQRFHNKTIQALHELARRRGVRVAQLVRRFVVQGLRRNGYRIPEEEER